MDPIQYIVFAIPLGTELLSITPPEITWLWKINFDWQSLSICKLLALFTLTLFNLLKRGRCLWLVR